MMGLPQNGERPGSAGIGSTSADMAFEIDRAEVSQRNLIADQGLASCPLNLMNKPGYPRATRACAARIASSVA